MRIFSVALCLAVLIAPAARSQAPAQTPSGSGSFTPAQRQAIVGIVRDALKNDPSILRDAITSLQAADAASDEADMKSRLAQNRTALLSAAGSAVAGNPHGDVTLVEFYDPRCPYCRKMLPEIDDILSRDPNLRVVYKDIPVLGAASVIESEAILAAARQGAYLKMQAALMSNPAQPTDAMIRATARGLGLDAGKLIADMGSPLVKGEITDNLSLAHKLKLDGTPVFIVGDTVIPGAVDAQALQELVAASRKG